MDLNFRIAVIQDDKILTVGDSTDFLDALFTTDDHKTTVSGYPSHKPIITDSKDDHNYETNLTVEVSSQHGSTGKSRILPSWLSGHNVTSQECVRKKADRKVRPRITVKKNNEDNSSPPIKVFVCHNHVILYFVPLWRPRNLPEPLLIHHL